MTISVRRYLWYVAHGVRVATLVDPFDVTIPAFRSNQMVSAIRDDDAIDLSDVFPGLRFTGQELFDELSTAR
jgi:hypothetical protein